MTTQQEDLLDAYLDNTLPASERAGFELLLAADEGLRAEMELHRSTREVIEIAGLKAAMSNIHRSATTEHLITAHTDLAATGERKKGRVLAFPLSRMWQAAAAVLLIGAGLATWRMLSPSGGDALYSRYYTQDAGLPGMMGSSTHYSLDDAMVDYKSGDYRQAIGKLDTLRQKGVSGDTTTYYLGMAYLGDKQYEHAEKILQPLAQKDNVFRSKAAWYEALTNLRLGKKAEAKQELEAIAADPTNVRAADAKAMLAEWR